MTHPSQEPKSPNFPIFSLLAGISGDEGFDVDCIISHAFAKFETRAVSDDLLLEMVLFYRQIPRVYRF